LWTDRTPSAKFPALTVPEKPRAFTAADRAALARALDAAVSTERTTDPLPFIEPTLATRPDQLVLVASQPVGDKAVEAIGQAADRAGIARLDAVLIAADAPALKQLANRYGGTYVRIPAEQWRQWQASGASSAPASR